MNYFSTRDTERKVAKTSAEVIKQGIADDGGLFMPESIPEIDLDYIKSLCDKTYIERAAEVLSLYLTDYTKEELMKVANAAITNGSKLSCTGFEVNKATYENEGKIVMYFELTNKDKRRSPRIMMKIPVLTQQYFHLVDKKAREAAELIKLA